MNLKIVPFDVAKDLKELGFNWPCYEFFILDSKELFTGGDFQDSLNHNEFPDVVSAPELDLVCKWFRDKHQFLIYADVFDKGFLERNKFCYQWRIWPNSEDWWVSIDEYKTYEEAELEGIKEAIKYLKNENNSTTL